VDHIIYVSSIKGTSFENAIVIDIPDDSKRSYKDRRDTRLYESDMGNLSNEVYYSLNMTRISLFDINSNSANIVYLFDSDYNLMEMASNGEMIHFSYMPHGQYYIVMEGVADNDNGEKELDIYYEISGKGPSHHAFIGSFSEAFSFTETRDTRDEGYGNYFISDFHMYYYPGSKGNEVYYRFDLEEEMEVTIHNAGPRGQPVATWIHLEERDPVTYRCTPLWSESGYQNYWNYHEDPTVSEQLKEGLYPARAYLKKTLPPGVYTVVTEGEKVSNAGEWNGPIQITIEGRPIRPPFASPPIVNQSVVSRSTIVYPNPTNDVINLELTGYSDYKSLKYNIVRTDNGMVLKKGKIDGQSVFIDISSANTGIYLLQVMEDGEIVDSHRIVKR